MDKDTLHLHQNSTTKGNNVLLLFVPAILYLFIIGFYFLTMGGFNQVEVAEKPSFQTASEASEASVMGDSVVDK